MTLTIVFDNGEIKSFVCNSYLYTAHRTIELYSKAGYTLYIIPLRHIMYINVVN